MLSSLISWRVVLDGEWLLEMLAHFILHLVYNWFKGVNGLDGVRLMGYV